MLILVFQGNSYINPRALLGFLPSWWNWIGRPRQDGEIPEDKVQRALDWKTMMTLAAICWARDWNWGLLRISVSHSIWPLLLSVKVERVLPGGRSPFPFLSSWPPAPLLSAGLLNLEADFGETEAGRVSPTFLWQRRRQNQGQQNESLRLVARTSERKNTPLELVKWGKNGVLQSS